MSEFKKGDLVKVTITDTVCVSAGDFGILTLNNGYEIDLETADRDNVTVEKIEPPVVQFQPGDRLRRRNSLAYEVTLGVDGHLHHSTDHFSRFSDSTPREIFNSESFEKVNLS